jgi:hypothetical protein
MALGGGIKKTFDGEVYILTSAPYLEDEANAQAEALRNAGNKVRIIPHKTAKGFDTYQVWSRAARPGVKAGLRYFPYWETDSPQQAKESAEAIRSKGYGARIVRQKTGYKYGVRITNERIGAPRLTR